MASFNCFILALFAALMFSGIDVDLAARRLQQLPLLPKTGLPPLPQPTIRTVLKPGSLPPLPSILNLPSAPKVTLPPLPSFPLIPLRPPCLSSHIVSRTDKLGMLGSRGSEPGFNIVGIVG
ncbi:hypothetical protein V6N12_035314 [Hibiscus sabdariffa]|uniref:Uncharacterized protein n=1 Tax=Hibiscus sabdariffa TaxID=183260 RepID=A0ABR2BS55_9ROSI